MRIGIHAVRYDTPGGTASIAPTLAATARAAEDAGVSRFTLMDHWFQMEHTAPATDPMLEGYTSLGFVAAHTHSMRLGLLVTGVTYRHPGLLAKIVATLDVLSGGRAQLGIGAGVVRARAPRPRRAVPARRGTLRAARGDASDLHADVE